MDVYPLGNCLLQYRWTADRMMLKNQDVKNLFVENVDPFFNDILTFFKGTMDFVPSVVGNKFETLEQTMMKANQWMAEQQQDVNIYNVQSIDYRAKASGCK